MIATKNQEGTMPIAAMVAANVIQGRSVAYNYKFQTWAPVVPEEELAIASYSWIAVYLKKMKKDLVRAGVWEPKAW